MLSTGVFHFSVWPDNNPTGEHGHGGLRLKGKLNTPDPLCSKENGFQGS